MPKLIERKVSRHWKIYRGRLTSPDMGNVICWATSESGIKKRLRQLRANDPDNFEGKGDYHAVYIEPTKRGVVEWLDRNVNYDNG